MTVVLPERAPVAPAVSNLDSVVRFAQLLSDADILPRQFIGRPANVLYAVEYGRTLGITPVAAITGIHIIEGRPSASSALIGALVRRAGHKLRVRSDGATTATAQIVRSDDPEWTYEVTWTLDRAAQAGLCKLDGGKYIARDRNGKPTSWEKYPAAMLKARAITEVARDACEDVLFGLHYTPEELGADVDADGAPLVGEFVRQPVQADQWQQPAPPAPVVAEQQTPPETVAAALADVPPESLTPAGRDYLHEAMAAPDAATVRLIWMDARAEGAHPKYLDHIAQIGKEKAFIEANPPQPLQATPEPEVAEPVADALPGAPVQEDRLAFIADLYAAGEAAGLTQVETRQVLTEQTGRTVGDAPTAALAQVAADLRAAGGAR